MATPEELLAEQQKNVRLQPTEQEQRMATLLARQGAKSAKGKSLYGNPVLNFVAQWKSSEVGGPKKNSEQMTMKSPGKTRSKPQPPAEDPWSRLMKRFRTVEEVGFAIPGENMIPGAAFKKELHNVFGEVGGVHSFNPNGITPEEQEILGRLLTKEWVQSRLEPGSHLTEEEKVDAQNRYAK